jgi:hypothetical protein
MSDDDDDCDMTGADSSAGSEYEDETKCCTMREDRFVAAVKRHELAVSKYAARVRVFAARVHGFRERVAELNSRGPQLLSATLPVSANHESGSESYGIEEEKQEEEEEEDAAVVAATAEQADKDETAKKQQQQLKDEKGAVLSLPTSDAQLEAWMGLLH